MEPLSVLDTNPEKRIVVEHTVGPLKGLHQILGLYAPPPDSDLATFAPNVLLFGDRQSEGISLIRQTHRVYWYRELMPRNGSRVPTYDSFNPAQR